MGVVTGWLRRNRGALVAAASLALLTGVVVTGNEWWPLARATALVPIAVDAGGTAVFDDVQWGPATAADAPDAAERGAPADTRLVVVEVPVDPGDEVAPCAFVTLRELSGAGRAWREAPASIDWYDERGLCGSDEPGPFTARVAFLIPADVVGPLGLELGLPNEFPRYLRLVLPA